MAGHRWTLDDDFKVKCFNEHVTNMRLAGKPPTVEFVQPLRSLDQNAMTWSLYTQIAEQKQDESINEIQHHCKLHYGVPILRRDNVKFQAMYDKAFRDVLEYEEKLAAMEFLPVTRLMNKTQCSEYLDTIIREYSKQGYFLTHPSEAV